MVGVWVNDVFMVDDTKVNNMFRVGDTKLNDMFMVGDKRKRCVYGR